MTIVIRFHHSHYRTFKAYYTNFVINLVAGLIAYCYQPKKPSLGLFSDTLPPASPIHN